MNTFTTTTTKEKGTVWLTNSECQKLNLSIDLDSWGEMKVFRIIKNIQDVEGTKI